MAGKSVVIIGSGFGGLVAGNLLAKKGHDVTIFESHSAPGGYTAGFRRNGFYFESGTLSFEASVSIFKAMEDIGVLKDITFKREKIRWLSKNFDMIPEKYDDFKKKIYHSFPSETERLEKYFNEVDSMYEASTRTDKKVIPFLYSGWQFFTSIISYIFSSRKFMKIMKRFDDMTIGEFNEQYFEKDSQICRFLNGLMYPDMAAFIIGSVMGMYDDYWTVSKGMQSWADVLANNFKELGGKLNLNSYVDNIITENGTAVGVCCKDVTYNADYVISASDYKKTFQKLLDDKNLVPAVMQEKIEQAEVSHPVFTVYLGLNISNEELQKHMKINHVAYSDFDSVADIHNPDDENYFTKCSLSLYSPSMLDSSLAPDGKSSLMLMTMPPKGWMNNWGDGNKEQYKQLKENAMEALIKKAENVIPDMSKHIEFKDAATPLTYERFTHNSDGATSAWNWNPKKKFFSKFISLNVDTPVKNLYIGSCWAMQIGGVPGALMAAYVCSKKIK
ncbi:MAG: NAD(P)/FAD-dependent oxidoreductase [Sedimentisphaerales bacterium]|nr:NAD(P)/FAD-dependent oxidoreductase [Sedimentisphaerales bacterium]